MVLAVDTLNVLTFLTRGEARVDLPPFRPLLAIPASAAASLSRRPGFREYDFGIVGHVAGA